MPLPTPFHERTAQACTSQRYKDWAGYLAVCSYEVCHEPEYLALRHAAGLIDVSPLFKYRVHGAQAAAFLAYVMARDVTRLRVDRVAYVTWCDDQGKVLDDGTVTRLADQEFRVTSAEPSFAWLARHAAAFAAEVEDVTDALAALAVQGPTSRAVLAAALGRSLDGLGFFGRATGAIAGVPVEVTRTGYTGDLGYEVWLAADRALPVYDALRAAGRPFGLRPAGLDALDMCRLEAGFVLAGVDYRPARTCVTDAQKSTPYELALGFTVDLERGPFLGQAALRREHEAGPRWQLVGLEVDWADLEALYAEHGLAPEIPAQAWRDARPLYSAGRQVGYATSGTFSPTLKKPIALASVQSAFAAPGTRLEIEATVEYERRRAGATVVRRPFFDPARRRGGPQHERR